MTYDAFYPGREWRDTDGNLIQAHAGYMFYENDTFYWYGENKEKSETEWKVWHWGVRLYSSKDLYNWQSEGIILPPELTDTTHPMYFNSKMDRPHILYNEKTGLYVMWIKVMKSAYATECTATIAVSKSIKGPFEIVKSGYLPNGYELGDFDLWKEGDRAYIIYEKPHTELIIAPLSDDYLSCEEPHNSYFHNIQPPFIREAPALFKHGGSLYMITSGTTAKFPNPSEVAVADSVMGDWRVIGDPHVGDAKRTSFDSQISCIFKHPKKENLFIAMADRWLIDLPDNLPDIVETFALRYRPENPIKTFNEKDWTKRNTKNARYVWLPIRFEDGVPRIYWQEKWRWEDYD
ncbi:MAG: family 43 glycosylhydrolase [Clostridia bacterium]|nr:family 43 glycosylhydrolase [Clostridia bacterium]